jgi:hypothetical protein
MEKYNEGKAKDFSLNKPGPRNLFKMSWTLTPNVATILEMVIPGMQFWPSPQAQIQDRPHTLLQLADIADRDLVNWFQSKILSQNYKYPILGNILIIDHYDVSAIVDVVTRGAPQ